MFLSNAKQRAKREKLPFNLTEEDVRVPDKCPVFGTPLETSMGPRQDNSPSLDRICPEAGYVRGNVRMISWRANRLKQDASIEDLQAILAYMRNPRRQAKK